MLQSGLEVEIYDTPAGCIHASQGTFFSFILLYELDMKKCALFHIYVNNNSIDQPLHLCSLISTFVVH